MRKLLVIALAACRPPEPAPPTPIHIDVPTEVPLPRWQLLCTGSSTVAPRRLVRLELDAIDLHPADLGPRVAERSHAGKRRTWTQLEDALARAEPIFAGCWKWAAARGAPNVTLDLAFTMTPFGKTLEHSIEPVGSAPELVHCLQQNLPAMAIPDLATRTTRMRTKIAFVRADQPAWPAPPQRPTPTALPLRSKVCTPVLDSAPIDFVESPIVYTVDDFDEARIRRDPKEPTVSIGCASSGHVFTDRYTIANAVEANRGAFQACYADAYARDGELVGKTLELKLVIADNSNVIAAEASGTPSVVLHDCVTAAAKQIWIAEAIPEATVEARVKFMLVHRRDDLHDPQKSLAWQIAKLYGANDDRARCRARAGILAAYVDIAPWIDDARVLAATRQLVALVKTMPDEEARSCLRAVDYALREVAYGNRLDFERLARWSWLERTEALFPIAHLLEWGKGLRLHHASQLAMTSRHAEGIALLKTLSTTETDPRARQIADAELDRYDQPKHVEKRTCPRLP